MQFFCTSCDQFRILSGHDPAKDAFFTHQTHPKTVQRRKLL